MKFLFVFSIIIDIILCILAVMAVFSGTIEYRILATIGAFAILSTAGDGVSSLMNCIFEDFEKEATDKIKRS